MARQIDPPGYHIIEQGEWIGMLAAIYGITKAETIWNEGNNEQLRNKRKTPNILLPGDEVFIPAIATKDVDAPAEKKSKFKLSLPADEFTLAVLDEENEPRKGVPYKLLIGKMKLEKKTDDQGRIKAKIPSGADRARLEIDDQVITLLLGHLDPLEEVSGIQQRLKNLGYYFGEVDGIEGPLTRNAVEVFQTDYPPLKVDGICGPKTREKLKEIYGC
jgi:N-acetylmuramoyl-L-alanine amidase